MSLNGVISRFKTGNYTVTRTVAGTYTDGRLVGGTTSTFKADASIQPVTGHTLQALPEGQHSNNTRVVFTADELLTRGPGVAGDRVAIDGQPWECFQSERWEHWGSTHWRSLVARLESP